MKEITIRVSDHMLKRLDRLSAERGESAADIASAMLRRGYEILGNRAAIDPRRGQRPGAESDARLAWWREARFGMFIHWGLYALPAGIWKGDEVPGIGEWLMHRAEVPVKEYERLSASFNPVNFDAAQWVSVAKRAGQRYLIITAKHHDGFCLFKSKAGGYNVVDATPFGRDIIRELAEECRRQGIRFGFYYSQTQDWHHPDGVGNDWDYDPAEKDFQHYLDGCVKPQLHELLTNYGPISVVWFDTPMGILLEQSQELLDLVHQLQPACLVSGRLGNGLGDYASAGDNRIPEEVVRQDWETPATINDTWGYKTNDTNWKSATELLHKLVDIVSKGGNYLLNVGPTADGIIPQASVDRLLQMGSWLSRNGESVYGTKPGPIQGETWCRTTQKENKVYLHVFEWPEDGKLRVEGVSFSKARLLESGETLPVAEAGGGATIAGPAAAPDPIDTVVELLP